MKNFKKVLVLLIAVAMIFSMVPSTSFAWADTENAVDTGDDSSSVFDVSEETETEEESVAVKDTTGGEEPEVAVEPEIVAEPEEPQVPDEQTSGVAADANEGGDKAVPGTDESSVSAETTGVNTTPTGTDSPEVDEDQEVEDDSQVRAETGSITGFSAVLIKDGLTEDHGNWVKQMSSSEPGQSVQYNVVFTVDVPNDSFNVGDLEIRMPKSIFYHYVLNADGTIQTDSSGNPVRELDQDSELYKTYDMAITGTFPFKVTEDGNDLILTNNAVIENTLAIYQFTIEYRMTHMSFDYRDYEEHTSDMGSSTAGTCEKCGSRPMNISITDLESGDVYEASADEVYIDTNATFDQVTKSSNSNFVSWNTTTYGTEEENSSQYNYVEYTVKFEMTGNPTERFNLTIDDIFTDNAGNNDGIIAYRRCNAGSASSYSGYIGDPVVFDEPQTSVSIPIENCTNKYFRFLFLVRTVKPTNSAEASTLNVKQRNDVTVTVTPICGNDTVSHSGTASFTKNFQYTFPNGSYMVRKFGTSNYSAYISSHRWPACTYELNNFQNDLDMELEGFKFLVDFYGNALRLTDDSNMTDPERVGMKPVRWELLDDGSNIALEKFDDSNNIVKESLTSDDYYLKHLGIKYDGRTGFSSTLYTADQYLNISTGSWASKPATIDSLDNDIITLYVQKGGSTEWIKAADIRCTKTSLSTTSQVFSLTPVNTGLTGDITIENELYDEQGNKTPGSTITFAAKDISGYRVVNENKHTRFYMTTYPEYVLRHTTRVDNFISGEDEIRLYNEADLKVYEYDPEDNGSDIFSLVFLFSEDADDKYQVDRKASDSAVGEKRTLQVDKAYTSGANDASKEAYVTKWKVKADVWYAGGFGYTTSTTDQASEEGYEQQHGGRFYDLLPVGTGVDRSSIKVFSAVYAGNSYYSSTGDEYFLHGNNKYLLTKGEDYTVDVTYDSAAKQYMFTIDITADTIETETQERYNNQNIILGPGYTVFFDTETSWTSLDDYGKTITNVVGYKTDGLHPIEPDHGNNANNVAGSELRALSDQARYNVDYNYTISKMESVVDANRDFLAFDFAFDSVTVQYNTSSVSGVFKRVQGENDASPTQETTLGASDTYRYRLRYQSGAVNEIKNIVIYDNIENYEEWDWRGTFKGFDFSELPDGVTPTVYYTTQDVDFAPYVENNTIPLNDNSLGWQELTSSTDLSTVRSIAISMGNYVMGSYSSLTVWLEFDAPSDNTTDKRQPIAQNDCYVSCTQNNYSTTSPGDYVTVKLEVLGGIRIQKVDDFGEPIEGVKFTLAGTDKFGGDVKLEDTTNARGYASFTDLPISGSEGYTLTEEVPDGYIDEGKTWTVTVDTDGTTKINGEAVPETYYQIVNHEETSAFADKKWLGLDGKTDPPAGASVEFTLLADGAETDYSVTLDGTADTPVPTTAGGYEAKPWRASFVHLPKYKTANGQTSEIVYTVKETVTWPTHTPSTTDGVASGEAITNTEIGTELSVTKAWKNADGSTTAPNGAEVTFTLFADGTETDYTVTLDGTADAAITTTGGYESEAWKATFVNLPKYKIENGRAVEIKYTVQETGTWPGYVVSYSTGVVDAVVTAAVDGGTITNIQEKTAIVVTKAWENADGTTEAPDGATVTFTLYADGTKTDYTAVLDGNAETTVPEVTAGFEPEAWTAAFVNLPKYKNVNGSAVEIAYTVAETGTWAGYEVIYEGEGAVSAIAGETISNVQKVTELSVKKIWENADGTTTAPDGATVTFTLYADGTVTNYTVTLDGEADTALTVTGGYESAAWTAKFVKLPKYRNDNGKEVEIVYTVQETGTWPGYTVSYGSTNATYAVNNGTISNEQETTSLSVKKAWMNADGSTTAPDGAKVTFTLYADGDATDITCELDGLEDDEIPAYTGAYELNPWQALFDELPKYKLENGKAVEIEYTVQETGTWPGYTVSYGDGTTATYAVDGGTITNTQETTGLSVTKAWKNADGSTTAPTGAQVTFTLYGDGEPTGFSVTLVGTDSADSIMQGGQETPAWTASFVRLPKYKVVNGKAVEIEYTVTETGTWPGYTVSYGDNNETYAVDGGTITNTQEPTGLTVTKVWYNADGTTSAPANAKVTFTLYADGDDTGFTVTLDGTADDAVAQGGYESSAWKATFVNLPKYNGDDEIEYTVQETGTWPGYTVSYNGQSTTYAVDNDTIINEQETTRLSVKKAWKNADGTGTAPDRAKVTFTLLADGTETDITCELDGEEDEEIPADTGAYETSPWQALFDELPKYKIENGKAVEIEYTVQESGTWPGYTVSYQGQDATYAVADGTITNTQDTTGLSVTKAWMNADGTATAPEGAKVIFTLFADGTATEITVELDGTADGTIPAITGAYEGTAWVGQFVNLPKYKIENGKEAEIEYTVQETGTWPGYEVFYEGGETATYAVADGTITNKQITTELSGIKTWSDADFFVDGVPVNGYERPESITINLLADGEVVDSKTVTEDDEWEYEFTDLPKYRIENGQAVEIVYTITEDTVAGYEGVVTGTDVDNTPVKDEEIAPTSITLKKVDAVTWASVDVGIVVPDDPDDPDEPTVRTGVGAIGITGLAGAEFVLTGPDGEPKTITTGEDGTAVIEFSAPGTYTLKETKAPDGYQNPGTEYTIEVEKVFQNVALVDDENAPGGKIWRWYYTLEVTIDDPYYYEEVETLVVPDPSELIDISGEKIWDDGNDADKIRPTSITVELYADGEKIDEKKVTKADNWKFTFTDLPKMKDGKEIVYTIKELPVKDYTTKIEGFTITNSHTPAPPTGDTMNLDFWIGMMALAMMGMVIMTIIGLRRPSKSR